MRLWFRYHHIHGTVTPEFEEVNMTVLYVFGGVIATFVVEAVIFTRF